MSVFDQRGQKVTYQYNAAGNINFDTVQSRTGLVSELEKLKAELADAVSKNALTEEVGTDVEYQVTKAQQLAKKDEPDKKRLLDHLQEAKALLEGVGAASGMIAAIAKAVDIVQKLF